MKNQIIKSFALGTLLVFFSLSVFSQSLASNSYTDSLSFANNDKANIPKTVTDAFVKQYPATTNETWSTFPADGYTNEWYNDSYSTEANASNEEANSSTEEAPSNSNTEKYYVVEFTSDETDHKSIYSTDGAKIATHRVSTEDVPKPVSDAIARGLYKYWDMTAEKKEIFKDKQTDAMKVYKVEVSKKNEKRVLYYQADGKLLKDKKV